MEKIAFVFPGQGSQYVGMGQDFHDKYSEARKIFAHADEKLGISLSSICFQGPEEDLKLTVNTQPAILTVSAAILHLVEREGITPDYVAGHSLGEYTALVAAGALAFEDAVWLVRRRGAFMQEAVPPGKGTMAAIVGLSEKEVENLCAAAADVGVVEPANYNCPGQVVIAGEKTAVEKAVELAPGFGARRAVFLPVSGPFHSSLLRPASFRLQEVLEQVRVKDARLPVMANVNAEIAQKSAQIKKNLVDQVSSAVRWQQSVEKLIALGVTTFVEIGPGKVLSGLIKKIDKNAKMYNIEDVATFTETVKLLGGGPENAGK